MTNSIVYDSGMLVGLAKRLRIAHAKHEEIVRETRPIVPGPVLAQVWRDNRRLQATLSWYLHRCSIRTDYSEGDYKRVGVILGHAISGKRNPDFVDALVAYTATGSEPAAIMTSDVSDIVACVAAVPHARVLVIPV